MSNQCVQTARRSRLAVAVGLAVTVAAAACSGGASSVTSPSGVGASSLAAASGQSTRNFSVSITPSVPVGPTTLHVTVTREATSGQSQKLGSVEIYVPSGFTIQSVSNISNPNWTGGVSGQTVRVGAVGGNHRLDGNDGSVTFDINVTSTACGTYPFTTARGSNSPYDEAFDDPDWTYIGGALSVEVTGCVSTPSPECKAAPAVANEYLNSIKFRGDRGDINSSVAQHMTEGARFNGIDPCTVEAYRAAVIAYVIALLPV